MTLKKSDINSIVKVECKDPFSILGAHEVVVDNSSKVVVRAFIPDACGIVVLEEKKKNSRYPMERKHDTGLFEVIIDTNKVFPYLLEIYYEGERKEVIKDPYQFLPVLGELDLHLFNEGTHFQLYDKFGAHATTVQGTQGVHFAVWAPNAKRVSVVGDFNVWDGRRHPMRMLGLSGVWELFIPDLQDGEKYKYEIKTQKGDLLTKSDPHALFAEVRPDTASVVFDVDAFDWTDKVWMEKRKTTNHHESPISMYELHLGSWKRNPEEGNRFFTYREMAPLVVEYAREMGYTHVELMPIQEHPLDASWGYQVTAPFAPTSRFGTPHDFMFFVDYCHQHELGVLIDWVPAHFPKDAFSLARFDGTCLYEHEDPRQGEHTDWGTLIYNYGRNEVLSFLISNAMFWCRKYHLDGLRVDAVASMLYLDYSRKEGEWIPNKYGGNENLEAIAFVKKLNETVHAEFPGILTIAEESTAWSGVSRPTYLGGLGFSLKWNMGWMNDTLEFFSKDPIHRKYHHNDLTFSIIYAFTENFMLSISHDEVVHGKNSLLSKMPGDTWQQFANLRLLFAYMYAHPGKKLQFMGSDFGQWDEWDNDKSIDWHLLDQEPHAKMRLFMKGLNALYKEEKSLWEIDFDPEGFEWIDFHDWENSIISFIRFSKERRDFTVCVFNFTPVPREAYRIGVPELCLYKEILNSDSSLFYGSGSGNLGGLQADSEPWSGRNYSLNLTVPPLGALYLKPQYDHDSTLDKCVER